MGERRYTGWRLNRQDRAELLERFAPAYPQVVADHVTLKTGTHARTPLPTERTGEVVGVADDGAGVQALVVAIGGDTRRADGSRYHITWSLDPAAGREAVHSNDVIREHGWRPVEPPVPIRLEPARWPR
jgi:hypothetical protein